MPDFSTYFVLGVAFTAGSICSLLAVFGTLTVVAVATGRVKLGK